MDFATSDIDLSAVLQFNALHELNQNGNEESAFVNAAYTPAQNNDDGNLPLAECCLDPGLDANVHPYQTYFPFDNFGQDIPIDPRLFALDNGPTINYPDPLALYTTNALPYPTPESQGTEAAHSGSQYPQNHHIQLYQGSQGNQSNGYSVTQTQTTELPYRPQTNGKTLPTSSSPKDVPRTKRGPPSARTRKRGPRGRKGSTHKQRTKTHEDSEEECSYEDETPTFKHRIKKEEVDEDYKPPSWGTEIGAREISLRRAPEIRYYIRSSLNDIEEPRVRNDLRPQGSLNEFDGVVGALDDGDRVRHRKKPKPSQGKAFMTIYTTLTQLSARLEEASTTSAEDYNTNELKLLAYLHELVGDLKSVAFELQATWPHDWHEAETEWLEGTRFRVDELLEELGEKVLEAQHCLVQLENGQPAEEMESSDDEESSGSDSE